MKEYRGCKYMELGEVKCSMVRPNPNTLCFPNLFVYAPGKDHKDIPIMITNCSMEDLINDKDPKSLLETKSKEAIDKYLRRHKQFNKNKTF